MAHQSTIFLTRPSIEAWSWQDIISIYSILGGQVVALLNLKKRLQLPNTIDISYPDDKNVMILRFERDAGILDQQINALDREIERRNNLVGVIS